MIPHRTESVHFFVLANLATKINPQSTPGKGKTPSVHLSLQAEYMRAVMETDP